MSISNGLVPNVQGLSIANGTFVITGGVATGTTAITADVKAKVGAAGNGSLYISGNGDGEVWVLLAGTWTKLTIN